MPYTNKNNNEGLLPLPWGIGHPPSPRTERLQCTRRTRQQRSTPPPSWRANAGSGNMKSRRQKPPIVPLPTGHHALPQMPNSGSGRMWEPRVAGGVSGHEAGPALRSSLGRSDTRRQTGQTLEASEETAGPSPLCGSSHGSTGPGLGGSTVPMRWHPLPFRPCLASFRKRRRHGIRTAEFNSVARRVLLMPHANQAATLLSPPSTWPSDHGGMPRQEYDRPERGQPFPSPVRWDQFRGSSKPLQ